MLPYQSTRIATVVIVLFFIAVLGYALFAGRKLLQGPAILVDSGQVVRSTQQVVAIKGTAERIVELRIDGRPVPVTEQGAFDDEVSLAPGLNRIELTASDKTGRTATKVLQVYYDAPATTTPSSTTATSSPPGSGQ